MPTWNQLPDGGDWLNRSRTPLSTSSSSLGSAKATVQHPLPSRPSSPKPSSSSSASAAERHIKERQQLNSHLPPEDRVAVKPPTHHPLPSRPSSPKPSSSGSARAAERHIKERQQLNSHLPPEDRVAVKPSAHHPLPSRPSSPKPSSNSLSSTRAAERQIKERQQLNSHLPPEDRVVTKPSVAHPLPSRPSSPKLSSNSLSSASAAERQIKERQQLNSHLPPEDRVASKPSVAHPLPSRPSSPNPSSNSWSSANAAEYRIQKKAKETFNNNYKPNLHPTPGSAADFRLAEERSKLAYDQNRPKLDAQVQQTVQQVKQERITSPEPPPEQHKSWWQRNVTDRASDITNKVVEEASNVKQTVSNTANKAWDQTKIATNYVKNHAEDFGHTALDAGGMIPVAGAAFDGANAVWYLAKGDKVNAAISGASAVPFIGDAAMAAKYGAKAVKGAEKLAEVGNAVHKTTNVVDKSAVAGSAMSRVSKAGSTPLRDTRGRYVSNPNSPLTRAKHKSPEYKAAQVQLKRETIDDPKAPKYIRAWLKQERMRRGNSPRNWRNPPGYDTGHSDPSDNTQLRWETSSQNRSRGARFGR